MSKVKECAKTCKKAACGCTKMMEKNDFLQTMESRVTMKKRDLIIGAIFFILLGFFIASLSPRKKKCAPINISLLSNNGNDSCKHNSNENGNGNSCNGGNDKKTDTDQEE